MEVGEVLEQIVDDSLHRGELSDVGVLAQRYDVEKTLVDRLHSLLDLAFKVTVDRAWRTSRGWHSCPVSSFVSSPFDEQGPRA